MKYLHLRNATAKIDFGGLNLLVDPAFGPVGSFPALVGKALNPMVPLPISINEALYGVDAVIVTHLHPDHWDSYASKTLPKSIPIVTGSPAIQNQLQKEGFEQVLVGPTSVRGVSFTPFLVQHGEQFMLPLMGEVFGFFVQDIQGHVLALPSDTILTPMLVQQLQSATPRWVVANAGGNYFEGHNNPFGEALTTASGSVILDGNMLVELMHQLPLATFIGVHVGAWDHESETRQSLRQKAQTAGVSNRLLLPEDGEWLNLLD